MRPERRGCSKRVLAVQRPTKRSRDLGGQRSEVGVHEAADLDRVLHRRNARESSARLVAPDGLLIDPRLRKTSCGGRRARFGFELRGQGSLDAWKLGALVFRK
jgi:hypothetical protein